jgi:hypothetical protein
MRPIPVASTVKDGHTMVSLAVSGYQPSSVGRLPRREHSLQCRDADPLCVTRNVAGVELAGIDDAQPLVPAAV